MKAIRPILILTVVAAIGMMISPLHAQQAAVGCGGSCGDMPANGSGQGGCGARPGVPCAQATNGVGAEGYCIGCQKNGSRYLSPTATVRNAFQDKYSPRRLYAHGPAGMDATRMHQWNYQQSAVNSWHGSFNNWRYNQPVALVVPPTAAYQTEYRWGVGQTRSMPIYHQYHRDGGNVVQGVGGRIRGVGMSNTPYRPSSTRQFGVYPVRGPW